MTLLNNRDADRQEPDSNYTNSFTNAALRLEVMLQDIAHNIQIEADFTLTYPEHPSIKLSPDLEPRFAQLPVLVQDNYLRVKLQQFLQHIYYVSQPVEILETKLNSEIVNQAVDWYKSEFFQQLNRNNHSNGYFAPSWQILAETTDGFLQVQKNDLTLHVLRQAHLRDGEQSACIGDLVSIKLPPYLVEPGYYVAVGKAGSIADIALQSNKTVVDLYINITSQGALALMDSLTAQLNKIEVPFHFKVLYRAENYIDSDPAILSFIKDDSDRILPIIANIYREHNSYFRSETPLFTKYLASGLSIAERPAIDIDIACHRCQMLAESLIQAWRQDKTSPQYKLQCMCDRFTQEQIDLQQPYLNPNSTDIYSLGIAD